MGALKWIGAIVMGAPLIAVSVLLSFYLPSTRVVQLTGTEVKRLDAKNPTAPLQTRDVYFIITRDPDSGRTHVFRNEDTGWGWPPYFKFDSGNLDGDAKNLREVAPKALVRVKYYGWRVPMLSLYPNAVDLERFEEGSVYVPLFNIVFLTFLGGSVGWVGFRIWRWRRKRRLAAKGTASREPLDEDTTDPVIR